MIKPLAKSVLIQLRLTAASSAADAGIHKKILGSGNNTLIFSNDEMKEIIEIVKYLEDSGLLLKGISETIQNDVREQKGGFRSVLLGKLCASLLQNLSAGKGMNRPEEGFIRAGYGSTIKKGFLAPSHHLTNFEIQKYYQNESRFNEVYSKYNLPNRIKDM